MDGGKHAGLLQKLGVGAQSEEEQGQWRRVLESPGALDESSALARGLIEAAIGIRRLVDNGVIALGIKALAGGSRGVDPDANDYEDIEKALERGAELMAQPECRRLIGDGHAADLRARREAGRLRDVEEQQLWVHGMVRLYGLRAAPGEELDSFVLDRLVGAHLPKSAAREMERRHAALRRLEAARRGDGRSGGSEDDTAVVEVSKLMDRVAPNWREAITTDETLSVTNASLRGHLASWLQGMSDETYVAMMRKLGIELKSDRDNHTRSKLIKILSTEDGSEGSDDSRAGATEGAEEPKATRPGRTATEMLNNLLSKAFGIGLASTKKCAKGKRIIDASLYKGLKARAIRGSPFSDV